MNNNIIHWYNYDPKRGKQSFAGCVSQTVPDQAMSIKEILARFTRNQDLDGVNMYDPEYMGDVDFPDTSRMTKQELLDMSREIGESIEAHKKRPKPKPGPAPAPPPNQVSGVPTPDPKIEKKDEGS